MRIGLFCGSSAGNSPSYRRAASDMAAHLVEQGFGIVTGGGASGMMGSVADTALRLGGEVVGVIPESLYERKLGHGALSRMIVVKTMHERKMRMADLADGFAALPGGFGTLEEILEALTWLQLGIQDKACGLLNTKGFFDPLLGQLDRAVRAGFLSPSDRDLLLVDSRPGGLADRLREALRPPAGAAALP